MIIHASLKTDITFFYMKWFIQRLKEGFFDIPSNKPGEILRYDFKDNPIEKIYLHTKNPIKINKNYDVLKSFKYNYEVITHLTMYDKFYETKITDKYKIFDYIRQAKEKAGKENNSLCYGPIFKTIINDMQWHINQFKFLCKILHKSISTIYYNFSINNLCKNSKYFNATEFSIEEQESMIEQFKKIAKEYNLIIKQLPTIDTFDYDEIDIGEKDSCPALCKHCKYITNSKTAAIKSSMHSPDSSLLIGRINLSEKIINVKLEKEPELLSEKTEKNSQPIRQFSLFDFV